MEKQPSATNQPAQRPRIASSTMWLLIILLVIMVFTWYQRDTTARSEVSYDFFFSQLRDSNVAQIHWLNNNQQILGRFSNLTYAQQALEHRLHLRPLPDANAQLQRNGDEAPSNAVANGNGGDQAAGKKKQAATPAPNPAPADLLEHFRVNIDPSAGAALEQLIVAQIDKGLLVVAPEPTDNTLMILMAYFLVPVLLFVGLWVLIRRTRDQVMGGGILSGFTKSPAKRYENAKKPVTFADVAGLEGVKNDLQEIVEF